MDGYCTFFSRLYPFGWRAHAAEITKIKATETEWKYKTTSNFRLQASGFRLQASGFRFRVWGLRFRV
jgi:hypothetical protein